jgi:hypothetical protein
VGGEVKAKEIANDQVHGQERKLNVKTWNKTKRGQEKKKEMMCWKVICVIEKVLFFNLLGSY